LEFSCAGTLPSQRHRAYNLARTDGERFGARWRHAFDLTRLSRHSAQIESFSEVSVEKCLLSCREYKPTHAEIAITSLYACGIRLDKLLACELGLSRTAIERLADAAALIVMPATRRALSQAARGGHRIEIDLRALPPGEQTLKAIVGDDTGDFLLKRGGRQGDERSGRSQ